MMQFTFFLNWEKNIYDNCLYKLKFLSVDILAIAINVALLTYLYSKSMISSKVFAVILKF